ncbi:MAG: hypothetical protein QG670_368, partial [Thermoproteota archaeon]|nr:hypothetical protein [Thermoproteota archaeon]
MNSTRPSFFETDRSIQSKAFRRFGVVLPLVLLVAIAAVSAFDLGEAFIFSPPGLILILHTIFLTGIGITVAVVSAKSYLRQGNLSVLILGAAVLTNGFASLIGGYLLSNYGTTIHNISYLVSSAAQVTSALVSLSTIKSSDPSKRKTALTATYLGVAILIIALTAVTFAGFMPVFLTPEGPTLIRQIVVSAIIYLFASSCILFYWRYSESKAESQYWYSLALGLFAIGFLSLTLQIQLADSFGWIGRIAQYSGSIFFLVALLQPTVGVEAIDNLSERWAEAFRRDKRQFDALFSNMVDGFSYQKMIFDEEGKPADFVTLEVNKAYKRLTGLSEREIIGKKATEVYGRMTTELAERIALYGKVALGGEPEKFELYVPRTQKWLAMTVYSVEKGYFAIIREDITERKKLEEEVSSVAKFPSENPYPVLRIGNDGIILYSNNACKSLLGSSFCSIGQLAPENWRQIVTDVLDSGKMKETEETLEDKMFSYSFNPVVESGYVNIYGSDITERKRLEAKNKEYTTQLEELVEDRTEELKLSYNKLNEILESLQEGFYVLDKNWDFVYANKQITSAVGMEPKDWIGQNLWKMFPNYVGTEIEENYRATMEKR